ncbi:hypothetical protein C4J91_4258 [Pseudomonas sp. R3-52-08]|nr:hypothetical protein C4J91_4258 [Pseudomonas sp. R3-52-08]
MTAALPSQRRDLSERFKFSQLGELSLFFVISLKSSNIQSRHDRK